MRTFGGVRPRGTVALPTPASIARETAARDRQLALFEGEHPGSVYLPLIRDEMRRLYALHGRPVDANDARVFFESLPDVPSPDVLPRYFLGAVFKEKGWKSDGSTVMSNWFNAHRTRVLRWRWEPEKIGD